MTRISMEALREVRAVRGMEFSTVSLETEALQALVELADAAWRLSWEDSPETRLALDRALAPFDFRTPEDVANEKREDERFALIEESRNGADPA